jgi:hypothetical protein
MRLPIIFALKTKKLTTFKKHAGHKILRVNFCYGVNKEK